MSDLGRTLIILGGVIALLGVAVILFPRLPEWFGRLPGDISIRRENFSFHFPLATCLLISAIISLIMWLLRR